MPPSDAEILNDLLGARDSDSEESDLESQAEPEAEEIPPMSQGSTNTPTSSAPSPLSFGLKGKVESALKFFDDIGLKCDNFLVGMSWGDLACNQDPKIQAQRTLLLQSPKLQGILERWTTPPRSKNSKKSRPKGARAVMEKFMIEYTTKTLRDELNVLAPMLKSSTYVDVNESTLADTTFEDLSSAMQTEAPTVWELLCSLATTPKQNTQNIHKNPEKVTLCSEHHKESQYLQDFRS